MEPLVCTHCGNIGHTESKENMHLKASCNACGKFIKFIPQGPFKMYYGKHKGKELKDVPKDYLLWCIENKTNGWNKIKDYLGNNKQNT